MKLEDIKADIARRGWTLDYDKATRPMDWVHAEISTKGNAQSYAGNYGTTEFLAICSAYEKALEGEGVKVDAPLSPLTWDTLVQAMADQGFGWSLGFAHKVDEKYPRGTAWNLDDPRGVFVETHLKNPVDALEHLLLQARARWLKPHPFDGLSLDALLDICDVRGWKWALMKGKDQTEFCEDRSDKVLVQLSGSKPGGGMFADWYVSRVDGLREQMKRREAASKTEPVSPF